jgi:uncharacterized protein
VNAWDDLPLLDLFDRLREAGLPLGVDEYRLFLQALHGGFGLPDKAALRRLCAALWAKSDDDERVFGYHFDQVMRHIGADLPLPTPSLADDDPALEPGVPDNDFRELDAEALPEPVAPPATELAKTLDDEVQIARAVLPSARPDIEAPVRQYLLTSDYLPITRRQMKQGWRYLRQTVREGPATEVDLQATIDRLGHDGVLLEPVRIPPRANRAELLLLIDQEGSMTPFHAMSRRLAETAVRGGRLGRTGIYYFHDCPADYLYTDPVRQHGHELKDVLKRCGSGRAGVLVFSDAGAARGGLVPERVSLTRAFLEQVFEHTRRVAWLNPMPAKRWRRTSAGEIARMLPMFELSQRGFHQTISVLRGRFAHDQARGR